MILNSRNASYYNDMLTVMFLNQDSQLSPMIKAKNDINVYPNPANSKFFIENPYEERKQIKIYSVEGKCVYQTVNSDEIICISVENLPAGLYFIELKNGNNSSSGKFVIEK